MFSINSLERLLELEESDYGNINEVNIFACDSNIFPEVIFELFNLEILNIASNNIKTIPNNFMKLPNLQEFIFDDNPVKIIPKSLTKCTKLNYLSFTNTQIEILPKWMKYLDSLEYISLFYCNIKSINFDITKIHDVNIGISSYSNIDNLSEDCKYLQFNYLNEPVTNLPLNLKKLKLLRAFEPINVKVPFGCELIIVD
jgi:Leucine-rich repeat (LRR) protein